MSDLRLAPGIGAKKENDLFRQIKFFSVVEDMRGGDEEDHACKRNDMRPQKFRSILAACLEQRRIAIDRLLFTA